MYKREWEGGGGYKKEDWLKTQSVDKRKSCCFNKSNPRSNWASKSSTTNKGTGWGCCCCWWSSSSVERSLETSSTGFFFSDCRRSSLHLICIQRVRHCLYKHVSVLSEPHLSLPVFVRGWSLRSESSRSQSSRHPSWAARLLQPPTFLFEHRDPVPRSTAPGTGCRSGSVSFLQSCSTGSVGSCLRCLSRLHIRAQSTSGCCPLPLSIVPCGCWGYRLSSVLSLFLLFFLLECAQPACGALHRRSIRYVRGDQGPLVRSVDPYRLLQQFVFFMRPARIRRRPFVSLGRMGPGGGDDGR